MVWDYANECAAPESDMKPPSKRWQDSERAKWASVISGREGRAAGKDGAKSRKAKMKPRNR